MLSRSIAALLQRQAVATDLRIDFVSWTLAVSMTMTKEQASPVMSFAELCPFCHEHARASGPSDLSQLLDRSYAQDLQPKIYLLLLEPACQKRPGLCPAACTCCRWSICLCRLRILCQKCMSQPLILQERYAQGSHPRRTVKLTGPPQGCWEKDFNPGFSVPRMSCNSPWTQLKGAHMVQQGGSWG